MNVFDVLREKLEEEPIADIQQGSDYLIQGNAIPKRRAIKIVNQVEQEYNNGWITCSEQLPPKPKFREESYLVQKDNVTKPFSAYWNGEYWTDLNDDRVDGVIAWQELPTRYNPKEC